MYKFSIQKPATSIAAPGAPLVGLRRSFTRRIGIMMILGVYALPSQAQSLKPDERGLWDVWCVGTNSAFEAAESLEACIKFTANAPRDPFVVIMSGFAAWHYLKKGDTDTAIKLFNSMLAEKESVTVLQQAGDKMARSWLTRLEREKVVLALRMVYRRDIEFPASLEVLKTVEKMSAIPMTDQWGNPWSYRLESSIRGMAKHRYVLESAVLGASSDLKQALKQSYADGLQLRAVRMVPRLRNTVEFKNRDGMSVQRRLGQEMNNGTLVYLGTHILLLSDGNHWSVMPRPR